MALSAGETLTVLRFKVAAESCIGSAGMGHTVEPAGLEASNILHLILAERDGDYAHSCTMAIMEWALRFLRRALRESPASGFAHVMHHVPSCFQYELYYG